MTPSSGRSVGDGRREREGVGGTAALANGTSAQQHNGANAAGQQAAFNIVDMAQAFSVGKVTCHNGKRFVAAAFAAAKLGYRLARWRRRMPSEIRPDP